MCRRTFCKCFSRNWQRKIVERYHTLELQSARILTKDHSVEYTKRTFLLFPLLMNRRYNDKDIVLKVFKERIDEMSAKDREHMENEINIQFSLNSEYCLSLLGVTTTPDGYTGLLLPRCDKTLTEYLKENQGKLSTDSKVQLLLGIARSIQAMHNANYIHRDLKVGDGFDD